MSSEVTGATRHFDEASFQSEVLDGSGVTLVDFWAEWCAPCRAIGPVIDELADSYAGRATIGKVDVDQHPGIAGRYGIQAIPSILIFRDGQVVNQVTGVQPRAALETALESALSD